MYLNMQVVHLSNAISHAIVYPIPDEQLKEELALPSPNCLTSKPKKIEGRLPLILERWSKPVLNCAEPLRVRRIVTPILTNSHVL